MGGFGVRVLAQAVYFLLLARTLGPEEYGAYVGVLALVVLLAPFASWGSGNILIKHVAHSPDQFPVRWGAALATTLVSGSLLVFLAVSLSAAFFGWERALTLALPLALGEMFGTRLSDVAGQAFQAVQRMAGTSTVWAGITFSRLFGLVFFLLLPGEKVAALWAWFYALTGIGFGVFSVFWAGRKLGWGPLSLRPMRGEWWDGFYFAVGLSSYGVYNDIDKALLVRFSSEREAGVYGVAYRFVEAALIPMRALVYASYPRFFESGGKSLSAARNLALKLTKISLLFAFLMSAFLLMAKPVIAWILGDEFSNFEEVLVWLLPLLFLRSVYYFAADALTGSGFQGIRTWIQLGMAALNFALNLLLIPVWSWKGAALATWISDGLLVLILWAVLFSRRGTGKR